MEGDSEVSQTEDTKYITNAMSCSTERQKQKKQLSSKEGFIFQRLPFYSAHTKKSCTLTWKNHFCNRSCPPCKSIFPLNCTCIHSTGRTWRARLGPRRWAGNDPEWAVRTPHSASSYCCAGGEPVPTFLSGHPRPDRGYTNLRWKTSWLLSENQCKANPPLLCLRRMQKVLDLLPQLTTQIDNPRCYRFFSLYPSSPNSPGLRKGR